jgi:hypothetical protein
MITGNPQATAPRVLEETSMPFMQAVAPKAPSLLEPQKSDIGFYSQLEAATIPLQNKGTGDQYLAQISKTAGVKPEEIQWTGLDEFLKGKKSVTKDEILNYLNTNRVDVQEVRLGGPEAFNQQRLTQLEDEFARLRQHPIDDPGFGEEKYNEMIRLMNIRDQSTTSDLYRQADDAMKFAQRAQARGDTRAAEGFFRQYELLNTRAEKLDLEDLGMQNPPKFSQYTLPGGENYREILLTLPAKRATEAEAKAVVGEDRWNLMTPEQRQEFMSYPTDSSKQNQFKSTHFDQPNILAHMRVNDRVVDGKKTLFIEEIQSDWHQAGRKKGYVDPKLEEKRKELMSRADEVAQKAGFRNALHAAEGWQMHGIEAAKEANDLYVAANKAGPPIDAVPDAPFKTSWHELSLKRAIQEASEKGYDQIAFTTGKTQAERYDLSNQVDDIFVEAVEEVPNLHFVDVEFPDRRALNLEVEGGIIRGGEFSGKPLEDVVGKEMAEKILGVEQGKTQQFSGEDLRIGGEGMKGFYDNILPKSLDKLAKKFDAKVGKTEMDGVEVWQMDITPKMRESVTTKGQPLFAVPAVGAGLLGASMMQDEEMY